IGNWQYSDPLDCRLAEIFDCRLRVWRSENGRTGHDNFSPGRDHRLDVVPVDAAVDLDAHVQLPLVDQTSQTFYLVDRLPDKFLPAETRVNRHYQNIVCKL